MMSTSVFEKLSAWIEKADNEGYQKLSSLLKRLGESVENFAGNKLEMKEKEQIKNDAEELCAYLENNRHKFPKAEIGMVIDYMQCFKQEVAARLQDWATNRRNTQARQMDFFLKKDPQSGRGMYSWLLLLVMKGGYGGGDIKKYFGEDYLAVGTMFHDGEYYSNGRKGWVAYPASPSEPGTAEWFLKESGEKLFYLDIRDAVKGVADAQWLMLHPYFRLMDAAYDWGFKDYDPGKSLDAFLYIEKVTSAHYFGKKQ